MNSTQPRALHRWIAFGVALAAVLLYLPTLGFDLLNWDDDIFVSNNPAVRSPEGLRQIWSTLELPPEFPNYPLTFTTFWLEHRIWGLWPAGYHATNVALHAANSGLVYSALAALGLAPWPAAGAALLFALHPMQVESVAWVSERKNLLSCTFALLALLAYWRAREAVAVTRPKWQRSPAIAYVLALAAFAAALLSKTAVLTLPLSLLVLDRCRDGRWRAAGVLRLAPFFLLSALAAASTTHIEHTPFELPLALRLLLAAANLLFYATALLLPAYLMPIYPHWPISASPLWLLPLLAVLLLAWLTWRRIHDWRVHWGMAHFVLLLLPTLGLRAYGFNEYSFVADRNVYFASIGLFASLALGAHAWNRRQPILVGSVVLVCLACLAGASLVQSQIWHDSLRLWKAVLQRNPGVAVAHANLGWALIEAGNLDQAQSHLLQAIAAAPHDAMPHNNLALIAMRRGDLALAEQHSRRSVELRPADAELRKNLAVLLLARHKPDEAIAEIRRALELHEQPAYRLVLARALAASGARQEAIAELEALLAAQPSFDRAAAELQTLKNDPSR